MNLTTFDVFLVVSCLPALGLKGNLSFHLESWVSRKASHHTEKSGTPVHLRDSKPGKGMIDDFFIFFQGDFLI